METPEKGEEATLPLLTPKTASGSQRIIKQIMVIDPNKLRLAGLDVKMAEALKKAKKKSQPKSKESKLAVAKSILNKKLKEALSKKDSINSNSSPQTPSKPVISGEEAAKKLSSSEKNKGVKTKPKISVATLRSLMPPPSFPVSSLISPNQTVEIKVLKSQKTKQSIEVKIVGSSGETPQKIEMFPKASLKSPRTSKTAKTQAVKPEVKLDIKKKSSPLKDPLESEVSAKDSGESSQIVIVHLEDKKSTHNSRKESLKEIDISGSDHSKSLTIGGEAAKDMSPKILHTEPPNEEKPLNEETNPIAYQEESLLVAEAESGTLIEMTSLTPIYLESLPDTSTSSLKITNTSTPIRRESLPKVIESKVLSPGEKIDLSILTKKTPVALTVPKKRYKLDQNWITSESNRAETVYLNLSPVPKPSPPKPAVQESAVDFINNLSLLLAESKQNKSKTKDFPEMLTKECGEDATSFLVSLFQKKQAASLKIQTRPIENNEGSKATPVKIHYRTNDDQIEQNISGQNATSMTSSNTTNTQVGLDLNKKDSPNNKNKTNKNQQLANAVHETILNTSEISPSLPGVKTLHGTTLNTSQNSPSLSSEKTLHDTTWNTSEISSSLPGVKTLHGTTLNTSQNSPSLSSEKTLHDTTLNTSEISPSLTSVKTLHETTLDTSQNSPSLRSEKTLDEITLDTSQISPCLHIENTLHETTLGTSQNSSSLRNEQTLHEATLNASSRLHSETISIQDNKSMIANSEKDKQSIEPIELPSDLAKTVLSETLFSSDGDIGPTVSSVSLAAQTSSVTESLQELVPESSTPPVSSRRKASKPIPVLIPKLRKSRKPATPAQKPPEVTIPLKAIEKPEEESPTQPVHIEAFKDSVPSESNSCQTEGEKEELPDKNTQLTIQKTQRKRRDTRKSGEETLSSTTSSLAFKDSAEISDVLPTISKTERPQRQRKISLKLIESSEFLPKIKSPSQGVADRTIEQMIKNRKESTIATERPQRQRKVSFKLLESSETLTTVAKPTVQIMDNLSEMGTTTERPQRQRKRSFKLLESSQSVSTMKPIVQVKNRSVEQDIKEKTPSATETEKPQCTTKNTETSDSLIAIEMGKGASKDPIAQLVAFHETVEKFELACGSEKPKTTENKTSNSEGEGSSLSQCPFYDAICSEMLNDHIQSNQPTESKENVSEEKISSKILRKRKDSLKSRKFGGDQISIVSIDSLDIQDNTSKIIQNVPSVKQTRKRKDTPTVYQSENEEVFESTPKLPETKCNSKNLISKVGENEEEFSFNSKELSNNSADVENINDKSCFSTPLQQTNIETPPDTSFKKRRGRPPKVRRDFPKLGVVDSTAEVSQPTIANANIDGSRETLPSTDELLSKELPQVEVDEVSPPTTEHCCIQQKKSVISKNSNCEGSWETLPSADEHFTQEVTIFDQSGSKSAQKETDKLKLNPSKTKTKSRGDTSENIDKVDKFPDINSTLEKNLYETEEISVNTEDDRRTMHKVSEKVVIIEDSETPKRNRKSGRLPKASKQLYNLSNLQIGLNATPTSIESKVTEENDISRRAHHANVSKISEQLILETTKEPFNLYEITPEVKSHEDKKSTSKSIKIFDIMPECNKGVDMAEPVEVVNASKNTTDEYETHKSTKIFIENSEPAISPTIKNSETISAHDNKTSEKSRTEPSKVRSHIDKEESLSRDDTTSINIGSAQVCEIQRIPKDGWFDSFKSPSKANESERDRNFQLTELEDNLEILKSNACVPLKMSEISLESNAVDYQDFEEQSKSIVLSFDTPTSSDTSKTIDIGQESNLHLSIKPSTTRDYLFEDLELQEREIGIETSNIAFSVANINESQISEERSIRNDEKETPKIVSHFEDLIFDMEHIESPSFSPIGESSRISNDSDGFEELDEDFTSAIIDTIKEAENSADKIVSLEEQTIDNSLKSCLVAEKIKNPSFSLLEPNFDNVKQNLTKSPEYSKSTESFALNSSVLATESLICDKIKPSNSFSEYDLCKKASKYTDGQSSSSSFFLAEKPSEDTKETEEPIPNEFNTKENSAVLVEKYDQDKESASVISSVRDKNSLEKSKSLEKIECEKALPNCLIKQSSKDHKSSSDQIKKGSALFCAVVNQSKQNQKEPKKNKAKNPFKTQIPKGNENESGIKPQTAFLGFNEKEIEDGQQSTSFRLSQSEDPESFNIESPSINNDKSQHNIKESQHKSGRKQKLEQKWEKNSARSLKSWLSKPLKSGSTDDVCDTKEDTKEQTSSIPPKKRRSKVQSITEHIPLREDVEHLREEINDVSTILKPVTEVELSVLEESNNLFNKKEKPKRGRKPKLKNASLLEKTTSSGENINSPSKCISKNSNSLLKDEDTSIDEKPKRGRKSKATNDEEFKPPRSGRKSKVANQLVDDYVKKETSDHGLTPMKERANKRKRSMSEENTPTTTAPPTKVAHLDKDLPSSDLIKIVRKRGRPRKSIVLDPLKVAKMPAVQNSPTQKKYKDDYEFNPRLLLIRKREELKSNEPLVDPNLQTEPIGSDDVQCALCMGYTPRKKWIQHVSSHYGIGWIVGQPPPLNINSRGSILSFMIEFYKVSKVKGLNCRLCNSLRRSGLGLMMHLEQCCLTEAEINENRVVCEYCKRNYTKASYQQHKRTCAEYLKLILEETKVETNETPVGTKSDEVLSNTGRMKRKAVIMAETKLKKLDDAPEFSPDDLIKFIPITNIRSIESIKENWLMEINSFGKGFCASKTCRFTSLSIDELSDHYQEKVCPYYEKAGYFCMKCKFHNESIESVRSHVIERHSPKPPRDKNDSDAHVDSSESSESESGDDEVDGGSGCFEVDANGERKPKRKKKPKLKARRRNFHVKNPPTKDYKKLLPERCSTIQAVVAKFYENFIETNYSLDPLFTFAKADFVHMEASESYFPKSADSMKFIHNGFHGFVKVLGASKVESNQWKQLERLHGFTENGEFTIYMGGPVKNIAWVPLDPHPPSNTQYLAVTVRKGLDKFVRFLNQKRSRSLIFILKFDISLPTEIKAEIIYAIAIDEGPIHAIEFLPSGGYAPQMNRLGMLAVGTIETEIKIYSLPLKVEKLDCDFFPIVRLEAWIELHLELLDNPSDKTDIYNSQCTSLVWSKTAGHNIVVGSFVNGFVGIWDISDDECNLNRFDLNERKRFTPVSYFWTSEDRLNHLALHYDMNGPRWLVGSNSTRKMLLYDLRDITQPMLLRAEVTINVINCIEWPIAWENIMFGLGDAMPSNGCVLSAFSPMAIMYQTRRFDKFCAGVRDIHYNIWRNSFAAGTDNGDVQVTPLREAVLDVSQRLKTDEKTILTLDIVPLNGGKISQTGIQTPSDGMRVFDKDYKDQYGIVFGSLRKIKGYEKPEYYNAQRVPPFNLHRLMRVSKIRYNQNKNACDVLAIGYDNGLLRVSMREWLKKDWR